MPSWILPTVAFMLGLIILSVGAEALIRGAMRMARLWKVSPVVIGLTIVAFGTSSPEMGVSLSAALSGQPDITMGNILGSNTANTDLILGNEIGSNLSNLCAVLGVTACITPIDINPDLLDRDFPVMVAFSLVLLPVMRIGMKVTQWEREALILSYSVYVIFLTVF